MPAVGQGRSVPIDVVAAPRAPVEGEGGRPLVVSACAERESPGDLTSRIEPGELRADRQGATERLVEEQTRGLPAATYCDVHSLSNLSGSSNGD